jgi:hypothetical protein
MRVIDPGHKYALKRLDGDGEEIITYVKREGLKYPGNVGHHSGTTLQECWRADIHRLLYVNNQEPCSATVDCIEHLRLCILFLEHRAALRHGRKPPVEYSDPDLNCIETMPTCVNCGHIGCSGECERGADDLE